MLLTNAIVRQRNRARKGAILVLVVLLLPVFLIIIGFSVDLAHVQRVRTELRAAVDLSAKAAIGELSRTQDVDQARATAKSVASANTVASESLILDDADIVFGHSEPQAGGSWLFQAAGSPLNAVEVTGRRTNSSSGGPVELFFGQFYGHQNSDQQLSATATALDVDICLVLDRSSSMKLAVDVTTGLMSTSNPRFCQAPWPDSRWVALDDSVGLFISHLSSTLATEHVGLVTFGSNYTSSCGETNIDATIDQNLDGNLSLTTTAMSGRSTTVWNGATYIDSGISLGRTMLNGPLAREFATKVMIVFTDGVYTGPNPTPEAAVAGDEGITVHTITFSNGANQTDMQAVAAAGNGEHYHAPDAAALDEVFGEISASIVMLTE